MIHELVRKKLRRNTLVIFFVDNGFNSTDAYHAFYPDTGRGKASLYELGMRTPVIFNYANRDGGSVYDDVVSLGDIFHTILDVTGGARGVRPEQILSGKSLVPYLVPGSGPIEPREALVTRVGAPGYTAYGYVVRTREWRYIQDLKNNQEHLYAILDDPHEDHDLAPAVGEEVLAGFRNKVVQWTTETFPPTGL